VSVPVSGARSVDCYGLVLKQSFMNAAFDRDLLPKARDVSALFDLLVAGLSRSPALA